MAEDLATAIVIASEKMQPEQALSRGILAMSNLIETCRDEDREMRLQIVPLYEHIQKLECRSDENESFEVIQLKTWYTFGDTLDKKYSSLFMALSSILAHQSIYQFSYHQDKDVEKVFVGQLVEKSQMEKDKESKVRRHYCEKKIVALFKRRMPRLN